MSKSSRKDSALALVRDWDEEAPDPERLAAYLDGELDAVERGIIESWIDEDPALAAELDELRRLRAELGFEVEPSRVATGGDPPAPGRARRSRRGLERGPERVSRRGWQLAAALAAALALVALALAVLDRSAPGAPGAPGLVDGGTEIRLADGRLQVRGELPPAFAETIEQALLSGRLPLPEKVLALRGSGGSLLSQEALSREEPSRDVDSEGPEPLFPVGTFVDGPRLTFRWRPVPGASEYRVTVADEALRIVANSPALLETSWLPPAALPRGRVLTWQVAATTAGGTRLAPEPPAPEARFAVLSEPEASRLADRLAEAGDSRLAKAVVFLESGLVDQARRELDALAAEQRDPALAERLRASLEPGRR